MSLAAVTGRAADSYSAALTRLTERLSAQWDVRDWTDGPLAWRFFRARNAGLPLQGWKIHISAAAARSARMLDALTEPLVRHGASFKVLRRVGDIVYLNSGDAGEGQLGKALTLYPRDDVHARDLIVALDAVWPEGDGPEVSTDLHVRARSAVSFRYGVFGDGPVVTTATGTHHFAFVGPAGDLVADVRAEARHAVEGWPAPPVAGVLPARWPPEPDRVLAAGGRPYRLVHRIRAGVRAAVCLAVDEESFSTAVVRVGRPGVGGGVDGRDIADRFASEFDLLRSLVPLGVAPEPLAHAAEPWPILVMADVRGTPLSELPTAARLAALPALADALARMHGADVVHGDVKLDNAIAASDGVRILDFELAGRRGDGLARGGTPGHIAPEAGAGAPAHPARDVYALGGCVFQAVLDMPPGLLPERPGRHAALLRNEGYAVAACIVDRLMAARPADRPGTQEAARLLRIVAARSTAAAGNDAVQPPDSGHGVARARRETPAQAACAATGASGASVDRLRRWAWRAALEAGRHADAFAERDGPRQHWRNAHAMRQFDCEAVNLGAAGIVLGLLTLGTAMGRDDFEHAALCGARWLAARPPEAASAGLFTGNGGVALALAVAGMRFGAPALTEAARHRFLAAAADHRELDLFSGCAGILWSACLLGDLLGERWPLEAARPAAEHLSAHEIVAGGVPFWLCDAEHDARLLGCAHGSAGVALALAAFGRRTGERSLTRRAIRTFRAIQAHGRTEDGDALRMELDRPDHHAPGTWCHGVAGFLWCVLQGVGDEPALRPAIDWAVARLADRPAVGTATCCHGLAGQLELWRMVASLPRFHRLARARAERAAGALRVLQHRVEGRTVWVSDDPDVVTPDLWLGFLGPATSLALWACGAADPLLSGPWLARSAAATRRPTATSVAGTRRRGRRAWP